MPKTALPPPAPEFAENFQQMEAEFNREHFGDIVNPPAAAAPPAEPPPAEPPPADPPPTEPDTPPAPEEPPTALEDIATGDPAAPPAAPEPPTEPAAPEPPPATPAPAAAAPVIDYDKIADGVADRISKSKGTQPPATPAPDPFANYTEEDRAQIKLLQHLQESDKYKGRDLVKETTAFWDKEQAYITNWRKENPGKKFNENDEEHEEFYSQSAPTIADSDLKQAEIRIAVQEEAEKIADKKMKERLAPLEQKMRENERQQRETQVAAKVDQSINQAVAQLAVAALPEMKDVIKNGPFTKQAAAAIKEKDPAAYAALNDEAHALRVLVRETERMDQLGEHFEYNPNAREELANGTVLRPHQEIVDTAVSLEQRILKQPKEQQLRDGRKFLPKAVLDKAFDEAMQRNDQVRIDHILNNYWWIGPADIKQEFINRSSARVQRLLGIANARGTGSKKNPPPAGGTATPPPPPATPVNKGSSAPPSAASGSDIPDTGIPKAPGASSSDKEFDKWSFA